MIRLLGGLALTLLTLLGLQQCEADKVEAALVASQQQATRMMMDKRAAIDTNHALNTSLNELLEEMALREEWAQEKADRQQRSYQHLRHENRQLEKQAYESAELAAQLRLELHPDLYQWLWGSDHTGTADHREARGSEDSPPSDLPNPNPAPQAP